MNNLKATIRETVTSGQLNKLRDSGLIPGIIYGGKDPNAKISVEKKLIKNILKSESFLSSVLDFSLYCLRFVLSVCCLSVVIHCLFLYLFLSAFPSFLLSSCCVFCLSFFPPVNFLCPVFSASLISDVVVSDLSRWALPFTNLLVSAPHLPHQLGLSTHPNLAQSSSSKC